MIAERILMALLLGGVAVGCTVVLYPFLSALLWAAILTYTTWPVYEWMRGQLRLGRVPAAGAMVAVTAVVVVLPLALAAPGGASDVNQLEKVVQDWLQAGLPDAPPWLATVPAIGSTVSNLWNSWAADLTVMVSFFRPYFGILAQFGLGLLLGLANGVLLFVLALFVAFFFYASGDVLADKIHIILHRIAGPRADRLIEVTGATVRGVVYGILGTAVVQGILTALGLWVSGVPRPALLGVVAGGLSVLPIGAPVVWIPASLWLAASGHMFWGIALFVYGAVIVSGADTLIRPYFIARGAQLPFLLTMLGVLGGAIGFGLLGIFLGPALLGVGFALVNEWASRSDSSVLGGPRE
ncbi:AI-2E family transporter [Limobrevibacterium gyesilva]|uniref:AI-2E family transporter n=1 Tax=Limobrevibacterium gyesilva TaxID=2991712 RepID=A0AA41YKN8_9PROT|nr:AI-2E family transporter [Limobrevibacterium gyesilva]MCW3474131.1 AI-2E family transporter [Limobrevibacterium gyesilva]